MAKMKALVFKKVGCIELEEIPIPEVREHDDVIVKVAACGISGLLAGVVPAHQIRRMDVLSVLHAE